MEDKICEALRVALINNVSARHVEEQAAQIAHPQRAQEQPHQAHPDNAITQLSKADNQERARLQRARTTREQNAPAHFLATCTCVDCQTEVAMQQFVIEELSIRKYYCKRFGWSDNIFDTIDWDIFRPVYNKHISNKGVQWMHRFCIKKLPTGERVHKRDHYHDKRCASCWHTIEDDNHIFQCVKRRSLRKNMINQISLMRNCIYPRLCDILQEGLLTYFNGESVTNAMLRLRGQEGYENYDLLIDEQTVIGWDNLLRGKFSKQWKIQQKAYTTRRKLRNPFLYKKTWRRKAREFAKNKNKKNKTEDFHALNFVGHSI
jgi:hypothetical protein